MKYLFHSLFILRMIPIFFILGLLPFPEAIVGEVPRSVDVTVFEESPKMPISVTSPNGELTFRFEIRADQTLCYAVSFQGKDVVLPSKLGVSGFDSGFTAAGTTDVSRDETWKNPFGERAVVRDRFHGKTIHLTRRGIPMDLEVRAYDEGIAFRYHFLERPDGSGNDVIIRQDLTEYAFPEGTRAWFTAHAQGAYSLLPLKNWPAEAERPLVLREPDGTHVCLMEAQVVDYVRTKFVLHPEKPNTVTCRMFQDVQLTTPFCTPWHIIMAAERSKEFLANNDLILNLNPPCAIGDTSWIKPGRIMRETTLSTAGGKKLVDFAAAHNIQYVHFDAGWYGYEYSMASDATTVTVDPRRNPRGDLDLQEVLRYAKEKGIGVFVYVNQRALHRQLDELLPLYEKWGLKGIKFGFVHVGSFYWTSWMHRAIRKCAEHHLLVDVHDEYRPTGFSRTCPNFLTQEGIRGNEEMPSATQNTHLPFTRFVAGPGDYTICYYFPKVTPEEKKADPKRRGLQTTSAHQLALSVICFSPLQFVYWYDRPESCGNEPELEFFDRVPTVWDDTKVLDGEIGEFTVIARRKDSDWYLGAITNDSARELKVPLDFLEEGREYEARIWFDDPNVPTKTRVGLREITVDSETVLDISLGAAGGQAIQFVPKNTGSR